MHETSVLTGLPGGHIDTMLLKVIAAGDCYGYSIYKTISEITNHCFEMKEATLYAGLRRLEAERFITAYWGDETQGGRRKYYTITQRGKECLADNIAKWHVTKHIMDSIIAYGS